MNSKNQKREYRPELLLPAGNMDNFKAAIAAGADAVYLGVKNFNARGRAQNFTWKQLMSALQIAKNHRAKIYVTLNTVIKNNEINELVDTLNTLNQIQPDAVIIQDWGVYFLIKKFFPKIPIHGSTQMGIHNSQGVNYAAEKHFERVILARELTMYELQTIAAQSKIETEIFIHGALCYSFSGMCLYSSFIGGQGANRGLCKQPCRRIFHQKQQASFPFSLKDLETINFIDKIKQSGVSSLKVEGRLKSANYVYTVTQAYKKMLNEQQHISQSKNELKMDMGRDKTGYFLDGKVTNAITSRTATGFFIGQIKKADKTKITIQSNTILAKGDRLRVVHRDRTQTAFKISEFTANDHLYTIENIPEAPFSINDHIYLASRKDIDLKNIEEPKVEVKIKPVSARLKKQVANEMASKSPKQNPQKRKSIYIRINDLNWIKKVNFNDIENLIIQLPPNELNQLKTDVPFIKKNLHKIIFELPAFIPEKQISVWQETINQQKNRGIQQFMISHLSQQSFFNSEDIVITNEYVYTFNDAAIKQLKMSGIKDFTYPLENDKENLKSYLNKTGIVPVYFRPQLFFSRMPVKLNTEIPFKDDYGFELCYSKQNNLNYVYPTAPVSFTHYTNALSAQGFTKYMADFSFEKPSQNRWKTVLKRIKFSEQIQPAYSFNLKNKFA